MSKFTDAQQAIIDDDMRTMSSKQVNEILRDMKQSEALHFLERLGHVRASDVYETPATEWDKSGCLLWEVVCLCLVVTILSLTFQLVVTVVDLGPNL